MDEEGYYSLFSINGQLLMDYTDFMKKQEDNGYDVTYDNRELQGFLIKQEQGVEFYGLDLELITPEPVDVIGPASAYDVYPDAWEYDMFEYYQIIKDGKKGVISRNGDMIVETKYDDILFFIVNQESDGDNPDISLSEPPNIMAVKQDEKWGFMDMNGNLLTAIAYDEIHKDLCISPFNKQYFIPFREGDKLGLLDRNGKVIIPANYEDFIWNSPNFPIAAKQNE